MTSLVGRSLRLGATLAVLALLAVALVPDLMARYAAFTVAPTGGLSGPQVPCVAGTGRACGRSLEATYNEPVERVLLEAGARSLVLIAGAAILALTVGILLGATIALVRNGAWRSGGLLGAVGLLAAVPSFFVAYSLQIVFIFLSGALGRSVLPVFGYGLDAHVVLPLVTVALPAVAVTGQLASARFADVLDADFVRTANAKGLWPSWILRVHVLPHVLPLALEAVGSGLRVSVASLPIVEYLFVWNGLGYVTIVALAGKDAVGFTASLLILATLFALAGTLADAPRPRAA